MLKTTFDYLASRPTTLPVPKSRDARDGYWNVQCIATAVDDTRATFRFTCGIWLDITLVLPIPNRSAALYEYIYLTISEMIVELRIEYLCSLTKADSHNICLKNTN